jgi:hypothetical protein
MSGGKKEPPKGGTDKDVIAAAQGIKEKSPLQQIMEQKAQNFFNWENAAGPKDILAAPGMDEALDIYGYADNAANEKRFTPALALAGPGTSGYAQQLESQNKMNRYDTRAQGLNQAFANTRGQAYGLSDQAIGREMDQKQAYANALGNYNQSYYQRPQKPPLWQQIAGVAMQGLQTGAMMAGV